MAAIVGSLGTAYVCCCSSSASYSFRSSSLFLTKLTHFYRPSSSASLRGSFAFVPFRSRRGKFMAHSLAQANLGLTNPTPNEAPQVSSTMKLYYPLSLCSWFSIFKTYCGFCCIGFSWIEVLRLHRCLLFVGFRDWIDCDCVDTFWSVSFEDRVYMMDLLRSCLLFCVIRSFLLWFSFDRL